MIGMTLTLDTLVQLGAENLVVFYCSNVLENTCFTLRGERLQGLMELKLEPSKSGILYLHDSYISEIYWII
jgi:hypothetical protein